MYGRNPAHSLMSWKLRDTKHEFKTARTWGQMSAVNERPKILAHHQYVPYLTTLWDSDGGPDSSRLVAGVHV
jgi:hypothetical protein